MEILLTEVREHIRSHETGITRGAEISRLDYPGYSVNRDNYYQCERSAPGYLGGLGQLRL